ncbi:LysR family transcriptional regulator [Roseobacter sp. GAI101]|uniref:LysR family transcriptional regulator n=1 Tax=Roseobacter sp. (strain GAI101) TaxID=391589 RepID=UPI0001872052|nr:LysR family transcriptional regulator [Roseobacter sp. GAI101]EEB82450.1 LysR substrate binding domain protein [Roseobacter sp. GAI101]
MDFTAVNNISLRQFEFLRAVIEAGSFSAAARRLSVSQPTLSTAIRRMEDMLGVTLFTSVSGRLVPSQVASKIAFESEGLADHLDTMRRKVLRIVDGSDTVFRFGASASLTGSVAPRVIKALRQSQPQIQVHLDMLYVRNVPEYLARGPGSCVLSIYPMPDPVIENRKILDGSLVCIMPYGHHLTKNKTIRAEDLFEEKLISFDPNVIHGKLVESFFRPHGRMPDVPYRIEPAHAALGLVSEGLGVAIVDEFTAMAGDLKRIVVRPLEGATTVPVMILSNPLRGEAQFIDLFEDCVRAALRDRPHSP